MAGALRSLVEIVQRLDVGNVWDGSVPTTTPVFPDDVGGVRRVVAYPADVAGGKFSIVDEKNARKVSAGDADAGNVPVDHYVLKQVMLGLGGQASWEVVATDGTDSVVLFSGTNETGVVESGEHVIVPPGWWVELTTVGNSTGEHWARMVFVAWDGLVRL